MKSYVKNTGNYYVDAKITDRKARDYINLFSGKHIDLPVSPQLVYDPRTEPPKYYTNWEFTHLAIVDRAGYGGDAKVLRTCTGDTEKSREELQQAVAVPAVSSSPWSSSSSSSPLLAAAASSSSAVADASAYNNKRRRFPGCEYFLQPAPANGKRPGRLA
jgi:hypothetical protein